MKVVVINKINHWFFWMTLISLSKYVGIPSIVCPYKDFKDIYKMDREISERIKEFEYSLKNKDVMQRKFELKMAGSISEGGFSARFFKATKQKALELDIEFIFVQISKPSKSCVQEISEKPGFVRIKLSGDCQNLTVPDKSKTKDHLKEVKLSEDGYIKTFSLKENWLDSIFHFSTKRLKKSKKGIQWLIAFILNVPLSKITISNPFRKISKAVCEVAYDVEYANQKWTLSSDVSIIMRVDWKPRYLLEWEKQKRNWPSNVPAYLVKEESFIIAKPSSADRDNVDTTEFRYSFGHVERKLVSLQTPTQRIVYMIFKSIFYKHIVPLDSEKISSFLAKSVMFDTCENIPSDDKSFWSSDVENIRRVVLYLLDKLQEGCIKGFSPYLFIPGINILENYDVDLLSKMIDQIEYLKENFDEILLNTARERKELIVLLKNARNALAHVKEKINFIFSTNELNLERLLRPGIITFREDFIFESKDESDNMVLDDDGFSFV
ncbi:uncharacterized protein [Clytia hemisphaerica]|uniref:Mab-21-like HhH/H2TH-like domain-containing protein n=1 Tax=Clytia hemisphaerica TaxID=252671 RepID=A0A7M5VGC5_9CNID